MEIILQENNYNLHLISYNIKNLEQLLVSKLHHHMQISSCLILNISLLNIIELHEKEAQKD